MGKSFQLRSWYSGAANVAVATFVLATGVMLGAEPALAELRYTTSYRQNPIHGTTPEQLWRSMARHPIIDEDGSALANITHDHKLTVDTKSSSGVCRVSDLDFTWKFVITLPKAIDEARMNSATRVMWREFTSYLKGHEEHHRTIFIGCANSFLAKAAKLTAGRNCIGLKRKVRRFVDKQYDACMVKQRAFDRDARPSVLKLALRQAYRQ